MQPRLTLSSPPLLNPMPPSFTPSALPPRAIATRCLVALAIPFALCAPSHAKAQPRDEVGRAEDDAAVDSERDREARVAFLLGRDAHEAGDFETALQQFQASYAASGRPEILYNIATSLDRLGRFDEALEYFRRYLSERPDAHNREFVESRMHVLEGLIESRQNREEEAEAARRAAAAAQEPPSLVPPLVTAGAGAALGLVSVGLLLRGHGQLNDLEDACEAGGCRDIDAAIEDSGVERTQRTVRALGIGGAALALGGALWLLLQDRSEPDTAADARLVLRPAIGIGSLHLTGRF